MIFYLGKTPVATLREAEAVAGAGRCDEGCIREATVKTHRLHIYAKLGVSDRAAAVAEGFTRGLLKPGSG